MNKSKLLKKVLATLAIFAIGATSVEARSLKASSTKKTTRVARVKTKARAAKVRTTRPKKIRKAKTVKHPRIAKARKAKTAKKLRVAKARKAKVGKHPRVAKRQVQKTTKARPLTKAQQKQAAALQQAQAQRLQQKQQAQRLQQQREKARRIEESRQQTVRQNLLNFEQINFIKTPLQRTTTPPVVNIEDYEICDLGFTGRARSAQYGLNLPTAPILHPYNPIDNATERNHTSPAFSLNVKLPGYLSSFVPEALRRNLEGINPNDIDVFLEVQDMPWQNVSLLLRPQSWLDPEAPNQSPAPYNKKFTVRTGIFSGAQGGPRIRNQPLGGLLEEPNVSTHNGITAQAPAGDRNVVSSSNTLVVNNLDLNTTNIFYSLTRHKNRAAVVKHVLLNPQDERVFKNTLGHSSNLTELRQNLIGSRNQLSKPDLPEDFNF